MKSCLVTKLLIVLIGMAWTGASANATPPPDPPPGAAYLNPPVRIARVPHWVPGSGQQARFYAERQRQATFGKYTRGHGPAVTPMPLPQPRLSPAGKKPVQFAPRPVTVRRR